MKNREEGREGGGFEGIAKSVDPRRGQFASEERTTSGFPGFWSKWG